MEGVGLGVERSSNLTVEDDEFEAYRKRMMLAYRFRPNPLVCPSHVVASSLLLVCKVTWILPFILEQPAPRLLLA